MKKIFLAIDSHENASEISENAVQITLRLAIRFQTEVYIACIAPSTEEFAISEKVVNENVKLFESNNVPVVGSCGIGRPSEHILGLSEKYNPNLIIMPIPYGERAETFEVESLGATVDIVLRKSPFPILLVRKPKFNANDVTKNILLLISENSNTKAAELALALGESGSKLKLLSITEKKIEKKVKDLVKTISSTDIEKGIVEHIHKKGVQYLVNKIFEEAKNREIKVERIHLVGNWVKLILEQAKNKHTMIIISTDFVEGNILLSEVENVAKLSKIPILILKT